MLPALGMFRPEMDGTCKGAVHFLTLGLPNTFCSECYRVPCFLFQLGRNYQRSFRRVMTSGALRTPQDIRFVSSASRAADGRGMRICSEAGWRQPQRQMLRPDTPNSLCNYLLYFCSCRTLGSDMPETFALKTFDPHD